MTRVVPLDWMPNKYPMKRIIIHWTAGTDKASDNDKEHYHLLVDGDCNLVLGKHPINKNAYPLSKDYAAHTKNLNTDSIGVALCGMAGAVENPFNAGQYPINEKQWQVLALVCADLVDRYDIKVSPKTILSHAEVQTTLEVNQSGKWDITRLPWNCATRGAIVCGDDLRKRINNIFYSENYC